MEKKEKMFPCDVCGKCFTSTTHVAMHKRTHTGEKSYSCDECDKSLTQSSKLATHKRTHFGDKA